ncbi:MAG: glucose-6-phosphate dehydrogenase [Anaerolineae bacterium]
MAIAETFIEENPLYAGLRLERTPEPNALVIFGASGDLAHRKLIPALYNLARDGLLPQRYSVVGVARTEMSDEAFRDTVRGGVEKHSRNGNFQPEIWDSFAQHLFYVSIPSYGDHAGFTRLRERLSELDEQNGTEGNRLFYLATPPSVADDIITRLRLEQMGSPKYVNAWRRIIVEKPFGEDLASARHLNDLLLTAFGEEDVFRIDHYLGKETVQNIMVFRFANAIFEPIWNRRYIDNVQITVAETVGVEGRGGYYDQSGALRDIIQNHGLQLLAVTAMDPPVAFDARSVRDEKVRVLRSIPPLDPLEAARRTVRGQYGPGVMHGRQVIGYAQEKGVPRGSTTETYVALRLDVDTWRWAGVPFYLRTGKHLPKRVTEIAIEFKMPPLLLFPEATTGGLRPNQLVMNIQPNEGISLRFEAKVPGQEMHVRPVSMDFRYGTTFAREQREAYERLLLDAMLGDATLFTRNDEVEAQWRIIQPVLDGWKDMPPPQEYPSGSWGPADADAFVERTGRRWRRP